MYNSTTGDKSIFVKEETTTGDINSNFSIKAEQQRAVGLKNMVGQKIAEVDIENHPLLGDTFIEYGKQSPLLQWKRIAEMLKECDLIVIEKPSNFSA